MGNPKFNLPWLRRWLPRRIVCNDDVRQTEKICSFVELILLINFPFMASQSDLASCHTFSVSNILYHSRNINSPLQYEETPPWKLLENFFSRTNFHSDLSAIETMSSIISIKSRRFKLIPQIPGKSIILYLFLNPTFVAFQFVIRAYSYVFAIRIILKIQNTGCKIFSR